MLTSSFVILYDMMFKCVYKTQAKGKKKKKIHGRELQTFRD